MSVDKLYPTKQEADVLAALVPKNHSSPIPLEDFLAQLLVFCQREDVVHFLFNKEPFQLCHLSSPELAKNAVSGMSTLTKVENNTTQFLSDHVRSMFFMAPVFTTEHLTFGFGALEYVYTHASFWNTLNPGSFGRSMSRFVKDESLGILVVVMDFPERDLVQVGLTQLLNATGQIHSTARFRRRELHTIYDSGSFNLGTLRNLLDSFQASYQIRDCPVCGTKEQCSCSIPLVSPKHPFDMNAYYANMSRRLGSFQGPAYVTVYQQGQQVYGTWAGSRCTISGGKDQTLIERLQKWAICESAVESDPRHSLIASTKDVSGLLPRPFNDNVDPAPSQDDFAWFDINEDWYGSKGDTQRPVIAEVLDGVNDEHPSMQDPALHGASERRNVIAHVSDISQGTQVELPESTTEGRSSPSSGSDDTNSNMTSKNETNDRELVKKLRAELRKERNRASAQRSNLRRKAENDARKLEIKTNKEKASLLRAKEMMLRQENMELRQQVSRQSATER